MTLEEKFIEYLRQSLGAFNVLHDRTQKIIAKELADQQAIEVLKKAGEK